jgi:hypothetical protein
MQLRVECQDDGEPAVIWFGGRRVDVQAVVDRWWGNSQRWWKVDTEEGAYVLRRDDSTDEWDLAAVVGR